MKDKLAGLFLIVMGTMGALCAFSKPMPPPLSLNTLPPGQVGVYYSAPIYIGGKQPYRCSITSGTLPPGLKLTKQCYIAGVPTRASTAGPMLIAEASAVMSR